MRDLKKANKQNDFIKTKKYISEKLKKINLPDTKSKIIKNNSNVIWCGLFHGLEGRFRKDNEKSLKYGRYVCTLIKNTFSCSGFFTSDELPRYGINRKEKRIISEKMSKKKGDLIVIMAYSYQLARKIYRYLINFFDKNIEPSLLIN